MISKKELKNFGFRSLYDYFDYMHDSLINGNFAQLNELINRLSTKQFKEFLNTGSEWFTQDFKNDCIKRRGDF